MAESTEVDVLKVKITQCEKELDKTLKKLEQLEHKLEGLYVRLDVFQPVQRLVYGMVATILISVLGSLLVTVGLK